MLTATPAHTSMRERIADALRNAILGGQLAPGDRIVESEVAAQLGTSRAPVREAIRELVNEGFLDSYAYRETRVSVVEPKELRQVLVPTRILIETFALREHMANPKTETFEALEATVTTMKGAAQDRNARLVVEEDLKFHRILVNAAPYLHPARLWASITPAIYRAFLLGTTATTIEAAVTGHSQLLELIRAQDVEKAVALLEEHIREMELHFTAYENPKTEMPDA